MIQKNTLPVLETNRLLLLPWKLEYAEDMLLFSSNANVVEPGGWNLITNVTNAKSRIKGYMKGKEEWAIAVKTNYGFKIVGSLGMRTTISLKQYNSCKNFGYVLAEEYWGQGICTEASQRLMYYAFVDLKCDAMTVSHHISNIRSKKVIEKCNFKLRGVYPKSKPDNPNSKACYIITKEDYFKLYGIPESKEDVSAS